ncbi:MAG: hypothetical protein LBB45_07880 [Methanobrevibacter sp.]|jgi:hypothetical protein|nr:hypothetical protein [Candidatus Methanovirga basalitermitum]
MRNILIAVKIKYNQKKKKNCKYEYKINMNLLAGKLKGILFEIIFTDEKEKKEIVEIIVIIWQKISQ